MEDWYSLTRKQVYKHGGGGLLCRHKQSVWRMVVHGFPQHEWKHFMFSDVPKDYWEYDANILGYTEWLYQVLGFSSMEDW